RNPSAEAGKKENNEEDFGRKAHCLVSGYQWGEVPDSCAALAVSRGADRRSLGVDLRGHRPMQHFGVFGGESRALWEFFVQFFQQAFGKLGLLFAEGGESQQDFGKRL